MTAEIAAQRPVRAKCLLGGDAPCIDDLCRSGGMTVCGLEPDFDFCDHGYEPETCDLGCNDDEWLLGDGE